METPRILKSDLGRVERALAVASHLHDHHTVDMSSHLLTGKGKRLRPAVMLLWHRAATHMADGHHPPGSAIQLAAMVEMIHLASVIHDDLIDESSLRRGRDALHVRWGNKLSTLMGDFLYARSAMLIASDGTIEVLDVMSRAVATMCRGEMRELAATAKTELSETAYLTIVKEKTADLFAAACEVGVLMAEGTPALKRTATALRNHQRQRRAARRYGTALGMAFQIVDDILDVVSSGKELGKPVGADIKEGRITLPVIAALRRATRRDQGIVAQCYRRRRSEGAVGRIQHVVNRYGGVELAQARAAEFAKYARKALQDMPKGTAIHLLERLTSFAIERSY